jgi:peptidoglycan/LPS O-acetylase OafA/YrhL
MTSTPVAPVTAVRPERPRLYALDGLRLLAALSVVVYHFTARWNPGVGGFPTETYPEIARASVWGSMGVQVFFVISGFVIMLTAWSGDVRRFTASRLARLYPAYWASVVVNVLLLAVLWDGYQQLRGREMTLTQILLNFTMVQANMGQMNVTSAYWTLWPELVFYLLVAFAMRRRFTHNRVLAMAFVWPLLAVAAKGVPLVSAVLIASWAPFFAGGVALYLVYRFGHSLVRWLVVALNAAVGLYLVVPYQGDSIPKATGEVANGTVAAVLAIACFAVVALVTVTPLARLRWRWLTVAGVLTYPLYLVHEAVGWFLMAHVDLDRWVELALAIAASLAVAAALHYGIERPLAPRVRRAVLASLQEPVEEPRGIPGPAAPGEPAEDSRRGRRALPTSRSPEPVPANQP